jgi:hypothetical protein
MHKKYLNIKTHLILPDYKQKYGYMMKMNRISSEVITANRKRIPTFAGIRQPGGIQSLV